jgi:FKBP-type peptidyl-prolyl cis-trans isomerase
MKFKFLIGFALLIIAWGCDKPATVVPANVQLERDIATIDQYLIDKGITAVQDTTGIRYVIHELGTGVTPTLSTCIQISYTGRLMSDETVFNASESLKGPLVGFVSGWQVAFRHFPAGTKATIYIPSGYGYGSTDQYHPVTREITIPANSNLIFDIELFNVYAYSPTGGYCYDEPLIFPELRLQSDVALIDDYLIANNISAQTDPSGLRYTIESLGTGSKPTSTNCIKATYTGKLLKGGTTFDSNDLGFKAPLTWLIEGWKVGMALLPEGTKATLYIPSGLGYGPTGSGARIPPNANLIYEIELVDVTDFDAATGTCN